MAEAVIESDGGVVDGVEYNNTVTTAVRCCQESPTGTPIHIHNRSIDSAFIAAIAIVIALVIFAIVVTVVAGVAAGSDFLMTDEWREKKMQSRGERRGLRHRSRRRRGNRCDKIQSRKRKIPETYQSRPASHSKEILTDWIPAKTGDEMLQRMSNIVTHNLRGHRGRPASRGRNRWR